MSFLQSAQLAEFASTDDPDLVSDRLLADGAIIVRNVVEPDTLAAFNQEIDAFLGLKGSSRQSYMNETVTAFFGEQTDHVSGLAGKSAVFRNKILCHKVLVAMCERVLRPHCATYQLNFADVMDRGPGAKPQIMHRDDGVWPYLPRQAFPLEFATMIALGPFTPDMGATRIVPGSHLWPTDRQPLDHEIVAAELQPGDAVFYLGSTLHAGGENITGLRRRGMHLSYCLGWLRTQDNNYLSSPIDLVRTLPREQQLMLGYGLHDGIEINGGFVGAVDWRDPIQLMEQGVL